MVGEPVRSLHVYSDVAGSIMVGNRVTDLLREVMYQRKGRGSVYFEPIHTQYIPLRKESCGHCRNQRGRNQWRSDQVRAGQYHRHVTCQKDIKQTNEKAPPIHTSPSCRRNVKEEEP